MQVVIDVDDSHGDRVEGVVRYDGEPPTRFSGWLELLRLLERVGRLRTEAARP